MDAHDMDLPSDEFIRMLSKLVETGFDFDDLLAAEAEGCVVAEEIGKAIDKHDRGPWKGLRLPQIRVSRPDLPALIDDLLKRGIMRIGDSMRLGIRFVNQISGWNDPEAKSKVVQFLRAIAEHDDADMGCRLAVDVCISKLEGE